MSSPTRSSTGEVVTTSPLSEALYDSLLPLRILLWIPPPWSLNTWHVSSRISGTRRHATSPVELRVGDDDVYTQLNICVDTAMFILHEVRNPQK